MASTMYNQKKQTIEDRKKKRLEDAALKYTEEKVQADKGRRPANNGFYIGMAPFVTGVGWGIIVVLALVAYTWAGPLGIIGATVLLGLWFAGATIIGIYVSLRSNKKADKAISVAREERRRVSENINQDYQKELKQLELWYQNYKENVKQQAKKYAGGTEAPRLAQKMGYQFEQMIETIRRDPVVKMIEVDFDYSVGLDKIFFLSNSVIDFEQERLNSLQSAQQCEALAQALARLMKKNVLNKYPQGQIQISHDDASVQMHYTGINPNHVPKRNI